MNSLARFACIAVLTVAGALGSAVLYLAGNRWFGAYDLSAMLFWSALLGAIVAMAGLMLSRWLARTQAGWRFAVLVPVCGLFGVLWTIAVAWFLGPWIGAFSFPVLYCWVAGGLLGGIGAAWIASPRSWPIALVLGAAVALAVGQFNAWVRAPDPQVRVILRPDATAAEVEAVWDEVLGHPLVGFSGGHELLPGISSVAAAGRRGRSEVLVVGFEKRMSRRERDMLMARIRSSPLVVAVEPVRPGDVTGPRPAMSY